MRNRRFVRSLLTGVLCLAFQTILRADPQAPTTAPANRIPPPGTQVAVVDIVRIFDECDQIKDLNVVLRDAKESVEKEAEARKKVLSQKEVELAAFSPDSPDYAPRRDEFARLNIEANVWLQVKRAQMAREHFNWTRIVYEDLNRAVAQVGRERGFLVVLQKREFRPDLVEEGNVENLRQMIHARAVIYLDDSLDITDAVLKKMNTDYRQRGGKNRLPAPDHKAPGAP